MLTYAFAGGLLGTYLLTWFWGPYLNAVDDQISGAALKAGNAIMGLLWVLYVS